MRGYPASDSVPDYHNLDIVRADPDLRTMGIATEHGWTRTCWAKQHLAAVKPEYAIVWEDIDCENVKITVPSPEFIAEAMFGLRPPIEAHIRDNRIEVEWATAFPGRPMNWKEAGGALHPYAKPVGPMNQEQIIEYILMKDVPESVWGDYAIANRQRFAICHISQIPTDRRLRNAWRLLLDGTQEAA